MEIYMCTYYQVNGEAPCCTHDCDGCIFHEADENDEMEQR